MNTEKTLSPQESLALIANVVAQTKENYKQQSAFFLLWGGLVSAASFLHYILLTYSNFQPAYLPWLVLLPIGGAASIYLAKRKFTSNSSLTYYNHFLNTMWLTLYAAFAVAFVLCSKLSIQPACFMLLLAALAQQFQDLS